MDCGEKSALILLSFMARLGKEVGREEEEEGDHCQGRKKKLGRKEEEMERKMKLVGRKESEDSGKEGKRETV